MKPIPTKINVGSGVNRIDGYHNIDVVSLPGVDEVCNGAQILDRHIEWAGMIEEIICFHTLEHFTKNDAITAIGQWYHLLKKGGRIVIEVPDLELLCALIAEGDKTELTKAYIFGPQDRSGQGHLWGWTPEDLAVVVSNAGFKNIRVCDALDYHAKERPCFRVEAEKV